MATTKTDAAAWQARGTEVRSARALLKRRIDRRERDLAELLDGEGPEPDEQVALDMTLGELLRAVPGIGKTTAARLTGAVAATLDTRLRELTVRRRRALAQAVRKEPRS